MKSWTFLGHGRLGELIKFNVNLNMYPVNMGVFSQFQEVFLFQRDHSKTKFEITRIEEMV